jgi:alanine racemase
VIKANAYGHGLVRAAQALKDADGFALLDFVDALRLRHAGVTKPLLMLEGFFKPEDLPLLTRQRLTPVIHNMEQIEMLDKSRPEAPLDVYLKVNSGMNRLGFSLDNVRVALAALRSNPGIGSVALMTHFADAEGEEGIAGQLQWFGVLTRGFDGQRSVANSAALLRFPEESRADWVAAGNGVRPALPCFASPRSPAPTGYVRGSCSTAARRSASRPPRRSASNRR